ncbi:MAG: DUF6291 domain-containing protein [Bacteroidota bacterium]
MDKKNFLFYLEWVNQLEELDDEEITRFIYNLIKYHKGEVVDLQTKIDRIVWNGVLPALRVNQEKYEERVERNRTNGKKGGRPSKKTQPVSKEPNGLSNKPKNPDGSSGISENPITDNGEQNTDNRKPVNGKRTTEDSQKKIDKKQQATGATENKETVNPESTNSSDYMHINLKEIEKELTFCFEELVNWQNKLYLLGPNQFIKKTKNFHSNHPAMLGMIKAYYKRVLQYD